MNEQAEDDLLAEHVKNVYAHFELAVYKSQVLECDSENAMIVVDLMPKAGDIAPP